MLSLDAQYSVCNFNGTRSWEVRVLDQDADVLDSETVVNRPHHMTVTRKDGRTIREVHDPRTSVEIQDENAKVTLFFDPDDTTKLLEVRLTPTDSGRYSPANLVPRLPRLALYARGLVEHKGGVAAVALAALRESGKARRGLPDSALKMIVTDYRGLVAAGEPHPIKALASLHSVHTSTASRWISTARARGLLEKK